MSLVREAEDLFLMVCARVINLLGCWAFGEDWFLVSSRFLIYFSLSFMVFSMSK